jgi:hypothetical protein
LDALDGGLVLFESAGVPLLSFRIVAVALSEKVLRLPGPIVRPINRL